jgi:drug/metabolite transporter (DMT)-like permease
MMTRARGTAFGAMAIAGWSIYGVLIVSNTATPPFLSMAIVFTFSAAVLLGRRLVRGDGIGDILRIPPTTLALGVTGLFGNNVLFVTALSLGGAAVPLNIASLSWPIFMMALVAMLGIARPSWLDVCAVLVGFCGVVLLALQHGLGSVDWPVVLALVGALCWALYSALRNRVPAGPADSMMAFVAVSAVLCWALTLSLETATVLPDEFLRLAVIGIVPVGLANLAWDFGARHGDPVLLAGLSFLEPIVSTALISVILSKPVTMWDAAGGGLVVIGVLFSLVSQRQRQSQPPSVGGQQRPWHGDLNLPAQPENERVAAAAAGDLDADWQAIRRQPGRE